MLFIKFQFKLAPLFWAENYIFIGVFFFPFSQAPQAGQTGLITALAGGFAACISGIQNSNRYRTIEHLQELDNSLSNSRVIGHDVQAFSIDILFSSFA